MIHIDDDALPHYEYLDEATEAVTEDYLGSEESNTSDDEGYREWGLGGYGDCLDNPARHSTSKKEDSFDKNGRGRSNPNDGPTGSLKEESKCRYNYPGLERGSK